MTAMDPRTTGTAAALVLTAQLTLSPRDGPIMKMEDSRYHSGPRYALSPLPPSSSPASCIARTPTTGVAFLSKFTPAHATLEDMTPRVSSPRPLNATYGDPPRASAIQYRDSP